MGLHAIIILAITVEALIEYTKLIYAKEINWKQVVALVMGVFLAAAAGADLYRILGVEFVIPYVGTVLTGIVCSRGSNYLADFVKKLQAVRQEKV